MSRPGQRRQPPPHRDRAAARGSLRFSFGPDNTAADVVRLGVVLDEVIDRALAAGLTGVR